MAVEKRTSFDIVIVGGGTAGLVLANRLSENPELQVLVLEAGKNRNGDPNIEIPAMMRQTWHNPDYDWMYKTTPQKHMKNRVVELPFGKGRSLRYLAGLILTISSSGGNVCNKCNDGSLPRPSGSGFLE